MFGLNRQRHDVFFLLLSCSALHSESTKISQPPGSIADEWLVHHKDRTEHPVFLHELIVDEVERVIRIIAFLLPHADIEIVNEVTLWGVIHLYESLRSEENRLLWFVGHKEILYNLVELVHVHLFLDDALSLHNVGSFEHFCTSSCCYHNSKF